MKDTTDPEYLAQFPAHVERLNSLAKLSQEGFVGSDRDLIESLFYYGLAWRKLSDDERLLMDKTATLGPEEWLFVYRVSGSGENSFFDRCSIVACDPRKEWPWAFAEDKLLTFLGFVGIFLQDADVWFKERPFPQQVVDLVSYYGVEEIFGSSYNGGFKITVDE